MRSRAGRHRRAWDPAEQVSGALLDLRDVVVAFVVGMLLVSVAPVLFGWTSTVVVSGSMGPRIRPGDVVAAQPVHGIGRSSIPPGTVVLVEDPVEPGELLMHRLVRYDDDGRLVLQGDANAAPDSTPVPPSDVVGIAKLRVPFAGLPFLWVRQGELIPVVAAAVLLLALIMWQPRARKPATVLQPPKAWSRPELQPK
ncbi:signal peptidase I [Actinoplanes sp. URMC 104]|uniref:signal peptidase I n=1 Tax=Actinoplanes sp. URMC 104 TaxID=3423409 RepID=UPI003F1D6CC1